MEWDPNVASLHTSKPGTRKQGLSSHQPNGRADRKIGRRSNSSRKPFEKTLADGKGRDRQRSSQTGRNDAAHQRDGDGRHKGAPSTGKKGGELLLSKGRSVFLCVSIDEVGMGVKEKEIARGCKLRAVGRAAREISGAAGVVRVVGDEAKRRPQTHGCHCRLAQTLGGWGQSGAEPPDGHLPGVHTAGLRRRLTLDCAMTPPAYAGGSR